MVAGEVVWVCSTWLVNDQDLTLSMEKGRAGQNSESSLPLSAWDSHPFWTPESSTEVSHLDCVGPASSSALSGMFFSLCFRYHKEGGLFANTNGNVALSTPFTR